MGGRITIHGVTFDPSILRAYLVMVGTSSLYEKEGFQNLKDLIVPLGQKDDEGTNKFEMIIKNPTLYAEFNLLLDILQKTNSSDNLKKFRRAVELARENAFAGVGRSADTQQQVSPEVQVQWKSGTQHSSHSESPQGSEKKIQVEIESHRGDGSQQQGSPGSGVASAAAAAAARQTPRK